MSTFNPVMYYPIYAPAITASSPSNASFDVSHPILMGICVGIPMVFILFFLALTIISTVFGLDKDDLFMGLTFISFALLLLGSCVWIIAEGISYIF